VGCLRVHGANVLTHRIINRVPTRACLRGVENKQWGVSKVEGRLPHAGPTWWSTSASCQRTHCSEKGRC
jgi:hypothetical protein